MGVAARSMTTERAYLDYNASAPLRPAARVAMLDALSRHGNASSVHGEGRDMKRLVEAARRQVAALVGADVEGVIFASSATEAVHLALTPNITSGGQLRRADKLFVLETEHPCVLAGGRFAPQDVLAIPVLPNGLIDLDAFETLLDSHAGSVPYVAVQLVNSETGVIQPVAEIAKRTRFRGGYVFCDAVQAVGRMPVDVKELGVDFLALSAHKIGGPQGAGALVCAHAILEVDPAIRGGGQEKNRRAGTENVAALAGFGVAAEEARAESADVMKLTALRDSLESQLLPICASYGVSERLVIFGRSAPRVCNTVMFGLQGLKAETALIALDLEGVSVSSGSACSSGKVGSSHVLQAMDAPGELAASALRVSLGWNSSAADVTKFLEAFERIVKRLAQNLNAGGSAAPHKTEISGAA